MKFRVALLTLAAAVTLAAQTPPPLAPTGPLQPNVIPRVVAPALYPNVKEAAAHAATIVPDPDAAIAVAQAARDAAPLEKAAVQLGDLRQFETARKLLDAALAIREQVSGAHSADYGLCLLKLGDLERKHNLPKLVVSFYDRAAMLLPGRPETASAVLYLGVEALGDKRFGQALDWLQRARDMDSSLTQASLMWTALIRERQKDLDGAESLYKSALSAPGTDAATAANLRILYARFLKDQGKDVEAGLIANPPVSAVPEAIANAAKLYTQAQSPYRVGGGVVQPSIVYKVDPTYTEEARVAQYSGTVLLQFVIGVDGLPHNIKIVKSQGFGLDANAAAAVGAWKFTPGKRYVDPEYVPVAVYATVEVNFRLL